jgi:aspartokinase-like uncharacterized kinase
MDDDILTKKNSIPIDEYLPVLIDEYKIACIILNGAESATITRFFLKNNDIISTQIIPKDMDS